MSFFTPLSQTTARRRLFILRHGHVSYFTADGQPLNPKLAPLTADGRMQAGAAADLLTGSHLERIVCSGLPRTIQTAEILAAPHGLAVEIDEDFREVRGGRLDGIPLEDREIAYVRAFENATTSGRFAGGDSFAEVRDRAITALERYLVAPGWTNAALVAHDGINRMILSWACGADLSAMSAFEQDYACINILDVDVEMGERDGRIQPVIVRRMIRAANLTPYAAAKTGIHQTSLEHAFGPLIGPR